MTPGEKQLQFIDPRFNELETHVVGAPVTNMALTTDGTEQTGSGSSGTREKDYAFLFYKARFGGAGYGGGGDDYSGGNSRKKDSNKKNPDQPGRPGPSAGRNPGGDDDVDDDDDDKDDDVNSEVPTLDGHPLLPGPEWTPSGHRPNKPGAKLPSLHPRQFYWNGERAKLRPLIQRWFDHLGGFQDHPALMFLQRCVPPIYKNMVLNASSFVACLQNLATYCANEEMYCKKAVENLKAQEECSTFVQDKKLLNLIDDKIVDILGINSAYHVDFATVKQILYKLSSVTIRDKL